ncbi:MAG: hypothetical protein PHF86_04780 [Candidatus Nanoarchaeia archaeon]|jgi:hypothetical protein|nr:hypothetical protein [Candidatus Nanoarchaeia archaeon]
MAGPFQGYAPPSVYVTSTLDSAIGGLLANLRIPALIGTAEEIKRTEGYELVRGSSPNFDNKKVNEDVSTQLTGTNRDFIVSNFPIVIGDGLGQITNNTNDVEVKVNGTKVIVAKVEGVNGKVYLALAPSDSDVVTVTYFYKKTDTKITDEDLSDQVDGSTVTFFAHYKPIVDGSNAGKASTNINNIIVKVNNSIVEVSNLDGVEGSFTLTTPPVLTDTLTVTYYFNTHLNTADDLPYSGLTRMIRVGVSPETTDFVENVDYAIINDQIQWGTGYKLSQVIHTTGGEFFDDNQIQATLVDDKIYNEDVSSQFTGIETSFTVIHTPIVDGTGRDIVTNDPSHVIVTVNGTSVIVTRVDGEQGIVYLKTAPAGGSVVKVTYWRSRMEDDTYSLEVVTSGGVGVGSYTISSLEDGRLGIAIPGAEFVANPGFTGANYITGPTVSKGYTVDETVTLTFTSNTQFSVTSTDAINGSSGFGITGSTYVDQKTGLMFTLSVDPLYASGDTLEINVTAEATFITSVLPVTSIPGMYLFVNNTTDVTSGDITDLITFDKSGNEPNVGDVYYVSYYYEKDNFDCALFTKFKDITNEYGDLNASNPLVLSSYLMFLNGATALILCQVQKVEGSDLASDASYIEVLQRLEQDVNGVNPSVIFPVTSSQSIINYTATHCAVQSSKRNKRERISFFGFSVGTEPMDAGNFALSLNTERMIGVYPDGAVIELVEPDGTVSEHVIDGTFIAAAFCGLNVNPIYDVATPMTRKTLLGFKNLVRSLDEVTMDLVATRGLTVIMKVSSSFIVRHGLTTNMTNTLTREIMVITIRDFINQETRRVLEPFIGRKMTSNLPGEISATLGSTLASAVDSQIITDYKGVVAERDSVQPDYIKVTGFYIPMLGLNWCDVEYQVRVRF